MLLILEKFGSSKEAEVISRNYFISQGLPTLPLKKKIKDIHNCQIEASQITNQAEIVEFWLKEEKLDVNLAQDTCVSSTEIPEMLQVPITITNCRETQTKADPKHSGADDLGVCEDADSDLEGLGWGLRTCISDKPPR